MTPHAEAPEFEVTPKQLEAIKTVLATQARYNLLYGGSRSGKTFLFCRALCLRAIKEPASKHLILRQSFNHVKRSIWLDTMPKVHKICFPHYIFDPNRTDFYWELPNESQIWIGGLDDGERTEKILGTEYSTILYEEASQIKYDSYNTSITRLAEKNALKKKIYISCNPPPTSHWIYKIFFEGKHPETDEKITKPENYAQLLMNPIDNLTNIDAEYLETLQSMPKRQRDRFLHGKFLDAFEGALWNRDIILHDYMDIETALKLCKRIAVAIDPAVTANADSDETGIVVVGKTLNNHYLVLADYSGVYKASEWPQIACNLYNQYRADIIVAETNNGGDLVERSIKIEDNRVKFKKVTATRGKFIRAEPIQGLYETGSVKHIEEFTLLEDQMCQFIPDDMKNSPDRVDALVWGLTELADNNKAEVRIR